VNHHKGPISKNQRKLELTEKQFFNLENGKFGTYIWANTPKEVFQGLKE